MEEIEQIPWNGRDVVSTFSGGGGSCLGYRMAGYHVIWASEFVEEAQRTYRANHKDTILDIRDIRDVTADDILKATNKKKGEIDLFDGSPPCCAFSTVGSREKGWGCERNYSDGKKQRIDDLFFEYVRILKGLQPRTFVAENVSGLVKGTAIGYFKNILAEMKNCGYNVEARLLDASMLGVPQKRERLIFVGVRNDLGLAPVFPTPQKERYTVADAFDGVINDVKEETHLTEEIKKYAVYEIMTRLEKNPSRVILPSSIGMSSYFNLSRLSMYQPSCTIFQTSGISTANIIHPYLDRRLTIPELKRITSLPDDFILTGTYEQQYERCGRMVPPIMMMNISKTINDMVLNKITGR